MDTVCTFQPSLPGKYIPCCKKLLTKLDTVYTDNPTTSSQAKMYYWNIAIYVIHRRYKIRNLKQCTLVKT